jgi:DNA-binding GntR family transcriptional regulator
VQEIVKDAEASEAVTASALNTQTLAARVCTRLEAEIVAGVLEPGARLDEQETAERFGVSRTPVREAFRLLAANALVRLNGRRGAVVRQLKAPELIEMFQVMAELEGLAARLAARRARVSEIAQLQHHHTRLEDAAAKGDSDVFYAVNYDFHETIYDMGRNVFLAVQARQLRKQVAAYRRRVTNAPNRIANTVREHEAVIHAIAARDAEGAHQAMRDHVNLLADDLLDLLAAFP